MPALFWARNGTIDVVDIILSAGVFFIQRSIDSFAEKHWLLVDVVVGGHTAGFSFLRRQGWFHAFLNFLSLHRAQAALALWIAPLDPSKQEIGFKNGHRKKKEGHTKLKLAQSLGPCLFVCRCWPWWTAKPSSRAPSVVTDDSFVFCCCLPFCVTCWSGCASL